MPRFLVLVGFINLLMGIPSVATVASIFAYGKYILVSCLFFWMASSLFEQRKQTELIKNYLESMDRKE